MIANKPTETLSSFAVEALADGIAKAVLACPGVVALSPGRHGEIATYLPGRRVIGVRVRPESVAVSVTIRFGPAVDEVATAIRERVRAVMPVETIDVSIDDVVLEEPEAEPVVRDAILRDPLVGGSTPDVAVPEPVVSTEETVVVRTDGEPGAGGNLRPRP